MPIALDATSQGVETGTTPLAWSHICDGKNRMLFVGVTVAGVTSVTCSGVTYNGVAMTIVGAERLTSFANVAVSLWRLINPAVGSNTVSVSFSAGASPFCHAGAVSYTGVLQVAPDATGNGAATTADPSITVTTVAKNCWVIGVCGRNLTTAITAGLTSRQALATSTSDSRGNIEDTNGVKAPPGAQTVNWTSAATIDWAAQGASFAPGPLVMLNNYESPSSVSAGVISITEVVK